MRQTQSVGLQPVHSIIVSPVKLHQLVRPVPLDIISTPLMGIAGRIHVLLNTVNFVESQLLVSPAIQATMQMLLMDFVGPQRVCQIIVPPV